MSGSLTEHGFFYKPNFGAKGLSDYNAFTNALDASDASLQGLLEAEQALNLLITAWATVDEMLLLFPATPTYIDESTFTMPGDFTAWFSNGKRIQVDLVDGGLRANVVTSSSFGGGLTTVILSRANLTSGLVQGWVTVSRNGVFPYGPGFVNALDFTGDGTPSLEALEAAIAAIGVADKTLILPSGTWPIDDKFIIPANINLRPERGAILNVTIPDVAIEGLSQASACVVTWTGHGLDSGDKISFKAITQDGWQDLNACNFTITKINDNSFSIPITTNDAYVFPASYNAGTDPGTISKVLDIRGGLQAGAYQIFTADYGKVVIARGTVETILPQWWGAVADFVTDSAPSAQSAFAALETGYGGRVHFNSGGYYFGSPVWPCNFGVLSTLATPVIIKITGNNATLYTDQDISILQRWPTDATANAFTNIAFVIDGFKFKGISGRLQVGLDLGGTYNSRITNCRFEFLGRGMRLTYAINALIENCMAAYCTVAGFTCHDGYGLWASTHNWPTNLGNFQNCRNAAPDAVTPANIEGMTAANPCVVTWTDHGLATGDVVYLDSITQANWTALNKRRFQITRLSSSTFSLQQMNRTDAGLDVDASTFGAYVPGTDPGTIQAAVFGFELINTYALTLDTCICEGGNLTDNIFFYSPASPGFTIRNYYSENTPYGAQFYLNYNGGLIRLDGFAGYTGNFFIDAYDMLATTRGVIETSGLLKGPTSQKIRIPEDNHAGYLSWVFTTNGGFGDTGVYLLDPDHWYGGHTPWQARTNDRFSYGHVFESYLITLRGAQGVFINQEPFIGAAEFAGAAYQGLRSAVNSSGGGGVGAYDTSNGQAIMVKQVSTLVTSLAAGAAHTISGLIPAGSLVVGVTARVTEAIVGPTSFTVGDGTTADKFGTGVAVTLNAISNLTKMPAAASPTLYPAATNIVLTATGGTFTGGAGKGKVRVTVHYITLEAPIS